MSRMILMFVFLISCLSMALSQITVDGNISETQYITMGTKLNSNQGFGANIDVTEIAYFPDVTNSILYIGIKCKVDNSNNNGIGLWLNFSELTGTASGNALGGSPGGHYMGGNGGSNPNFKADFEVDYMFAWNPGGNPADCFVDAVKLVGGRTAEFLGNCGQSGTSITNGGGIFAAGSVSFAFQNGGGNLGFEISFPFSELGVTSAGNFSAFAFVVSSTAFFSNVTVPGDVTVNNLGFDADFSTLSGGPYHTTPDLSLPVSLSSFTATAGNNQVMLNWVTESEIQNVGFEILRAQGESEEYTQISSYQNNPALRGQFTTNKRTLYSFTDKLVVNGQTYRYKLVDVDVNGMRTEHGPVTATPLAGGSEITTTGTSIPEEYMLAPNFPNPFNPATRIQFGVPQTIAGSENVILSVFNIQGLKIKELINAKLAPGTYEVQWDGTNDRGAQVASGIYFYQLRTNSWLQTRKMMLIR